MNRRISIGIVIALLLSVALFSMASAHAKLVSSDPAAGTKLTTAPAKVTLVFDEEISDKATESFFNVTNEAGAAVGSGKLDTADLDHKTLSGALNSGLGDGIYTVTWQTITTDDNGKSEGSFAFGVNKEPGAQPTAAPHETTPTAAPTAAGAAKPTAVPAAAGAAKPTAVPAAAGAAPATLPTTGEPAQSLAGYFMLGALLLLAAGIALLRLRRRA
jgi:methionine-rich copper-binding protein CopC